MFQSTNIICLTLLVLCIGTGLATKKSEDYQKGRQAAELKIEAISQFARKKIEQGKKTVERSYEIVCSADKNAHNDFHQGVLDQFKSINIKERADRDGCKKSERTTVYALYNFFVDVAEGNIKSESYGPSVRYCKFVVMAIKEVYSSVLEDRIKKQLGHLRAVNSLM